MGWSKNCVIRNVIRDGIGYPKIVVLDLVIPLAANGRAVSWPPAELVPTEQDPRQRQDQVPQHPDLATPG